VALARSGDHVRVIVEAKALQADPKVAAEGLYDLACAYAVSADAARSDSRLPATEQKVLAERYAAAAVALLHKIQVQGYFQVEARAKTLANDEDLKTLRGRTDFQLLLKQTAPRKK
jgi:hypothetical protein